MHAAEHGLIGMLPLFTICDRWDVGGVSMALHPQTGRQPTIFVYDGYPGGAGIAELAFDAAARHARATLDLIAACSVRRRLPVVRAVAEVRELERVPRQARRGRAARDDDAANAELRQHPRPARRDQIRAVRRLVIGRLRHERRFDGDTRVFGVHPFA